MRRVGLRASRSKSTKAVNKLIKDFPHSAEAWYQHARVYVEVDEDRALLDLKISIQLEPYREEPYLMAVDIMRAKGRNKESKLILDKGLESLPDSMRLRSGLAETYVSFGYHHKNTQAFDLAIESAERALAVMPDLVAAWQLAGEVRREMAEIAKEPSRKRREWERSKDCFEKLRHFDPPNTVARMGLAAYHKTKGYAFLYTRLPKDLAAGEKKKQRQEIRRQAMVEFLRACTLAPGAEEFQEIASQLEHYAAELRDVADQMLERLDTGEAFVAGEKALKFAPLDPENHALRGRILTRLGRFEDAVVAYQDALKLDSKHLRSLFDLATLNYDRFRFRESVQLLDTFLAATATATAKNKALHEVRESAKALKQRAQRKLESGDNK